MRSTSVVIAFILATAVICIPSLAQAPQQTLSGTIRDFTGVNATAHPFSTHPDFDQFNFGPLLDLQEVIDNGGFPTQDQIDDALAGVPGEYLPAIPFFNPGGQDQTNLVEPGIVSDTITPGGKPSYVGGTNSPPLHKSTSSDARFIEWFTDVPGVNQSRLIDLALNDPESDGVYSFEASRDLDADDGDSDGGFFPIDGELGGNDGAARDGTPHNYSFTVEFHTTAAYTASAGQTFTFKGDDDLWLFLGGKLVMDLGGVHNELTGSVNLDDLAAQLNIIDGDKVPFDLFYAERNQYNSDLKIETSFAFTQGPDDGGGPGPGPTPIPLPAAVWTGLAMLGALTGIQRLRRRGCD